MNNAVFIAWRSGDPSQGCWAPVGKLERCGPVYRFLYTRGAQTTPGFRPLPGMFALDAVYESERLFPVFSNRLLSESRPEYEAYLTWGGFDSSNPPDPLAILGVTEGIRQTDSLEIFPCPSPDLDGCYVTKFFLHGIRWSPSSAIHCITQLKHGDRLALMPDWMNEFDEFAVAVRTADVRDRYLIGYVPRYLARGVLELSSKCGPQFIDVSVERINLGAPLQMRVLCRMNACWPEGFLPCSGDDFQPIVNSSVYTQD